MNEIPLGLTFDDVLIVPQYSRVQSRDNVVLSTLLGQGQPALTIPIVASPMDTVCEWEMAQAMADLGGIGFIHRYMKPEEQVSQFQKVNGRCGVAVGLHDCVNAERLSMLVEAGAKDIVLDVAYGDNAHVEDIVKFIKYEYKYVTLTVGNVTSFGGFARLANAGADAIRVGIGGGSACSTRITTGIGIPQLTAIMNCADIAKDLGVTLIADGGIRNGADIAKALGAGADVVMLGNLLAATVESPAPIAFQRPKDGPHYKQFRGMASKEAQSARNCKLTGHSDDTKIYSEGVSGFVKVSGHVEDVISDLLKGVRSAFSYVGAHTLSDFHNKVDFMRMTPAGVVESNPHDIER